MVHHNVLPDSELSYFLARSPSGLQYLSFRGTSNLENALVDLDLSLQLDAGLNIQLHQGFAAAAQAAYEDIRLKLDKSQPIINQKSSASTQSTQTKYRSPHCPSICRQLGYTIEIDEYRKRYDSQPHLPSG